MVISCIYKALSSKVIDYFPLIVTSTHTHTHKSMDMSYQTSLKTLWQTERRRWGSTLWSVVDPLSPLSHSCLCYVLDLFTLYPKLCSGEMVFIVPLYWTCLLFCFCYHIAFIFDHITDVIRGIIRCLRWLLGDPSAAELCIADGTNNVHCRSYQARGSRFLLAGWGLGNGKP